jgi:hypothetical protein
MHVEEEKNPAQEAEQPEEDTERIESDVSKGKGPQQEEQAMVSLQQGLEPEEQSMKQSILGHTSSWGIVPTREEEGTSREQCARRTMHIGKIGHSDAKNPQGSEGR